MIYIKKINVINYINDKVVKNYKNCGADCFGCYYN